MENKRYKSLNIVDIYGNVLAEVCEVFANDEEREEYVETVASRALPPKVFFERTNRTELEWEDLRIRFTAKRMIKAIFEDK